MNKNYLENKELFAIHTDNTNTPKIIKCRYQKLLDITGYETVAIELPDKSVLTFGLNELRELVGGE